MPSLTIGYFTVQSKINTDISFYETKIKQNNQTRKQRKII
jgi:hypothetical protein